MAGSSTDEEAGIICKSQNNILIFNICHENERLYSAIGNFLSCAFFYPVLRMCSWNSQSRFKGFVLFG